MLQILFALTSILIGGGVGVISTQILFKANGWLSANSPEQKNWDYVHLAGLAGAFVTAVGGTIAYDNQCIALTLLFLLCGGFTVSTIVVLVQLLTDAVTCVRQYLSPRQWNVDDYFGWDDNHLTPVGVFICGLFTASGAAGIVVCLLVLRQLGM